jgi:putative PEP-CTERM system histidine kinase
MMPPVPITAIDLLVGLVYGLIAALVAFHSGRQAGWVWVAAAPMATALWAVARLLEGTGGLAPGSLALAGLDVLRLLAWIALLGLALRRGLPEGAVDQRTPWLLATAAVGGLLVIGLAALEGGRADPHSARFVVDVYGRLLLATLGLMLTEALLRQARAESLWRIKYFCFGVGAILVYDLFLGSEALLFRRWDPVLEGGQGVISLIAAPFLAVAVARNPAWSVELNIARRAVLHSFVLLGVAAYMLAVAGAGLLLSRVGGDWGRLLQASFFVGALILLGALYFSTTARYVAKHRLSRYLFTYRHDYREQWQRFGEAFASESGGRNLRERALDAVAAVFESPHAGLWLREEELFRLEAARRLPNAAGDVPAAGKLAMELEAHPDRIVELAAAGEAERRPDSLPEWLRDWPPAWLVVPLVHRSELIGFVVLTRPWLSLTLQQEDEELLLMVASHAASYIGEERSTRALEQAKRFEELSRGMAFIAHDLRNVANDLDLMLDNARKHLHKPEFQRDLVLSMGDSVERMKGLLDRLSGSADRSSERVATDLVKLVRDAVTTRFSERPVVRMELDEEGPLFVAGGADRLTAITGHLVRNAIEAAGPDGHVTLRVCPDRGGALFEVADDGPGMAPEFLKERLQHPLPSGKRGGFGIGLYECRELARQLGGRLEVESEPGRGTKARIWLPLLESEGGRRNAAG